MAQALAFDCIICGGQLVSLMGRECDRFLMLFTTSIFVSTWLKNTKIDLLAKPVFYESP